MLEETKRLLGSDAAMFAGTNAEHELNGGDGGRVTAGTDGPGGPGGTGLTGSANDGGTAGVIVNWPAREGNH